MRQDSIAQEKPGIGPSVWQYFLCKTGVKKISGFAGCDGNVMLRDYLHSCGQHSDSDSPSLLSFMGSFL